MGSVSNGETVVRPGGGGRRGFAVVDVCGEAVADLAEQLVDLRLFALGDQLDPAVSEVAHRAGHRQTGGDPGGRRAETNPLDFAAEQNGPLLGH